MKASTISVNPAAKTKADLLGFVSSTCLNPDSALRFMRRERRSVHPATLDLSELPPITAEAADSCRRTHRRHNLTVAAAFTTALAFALLL